MKKSLPPNRTRLLAAGLLAGLSIGGCSDAATTFGATAQGNNPGSPPAPPGSTTARVIEPAARTGGHVKASGASYQISLQPGWNLFSMPIASPTTFTVNGTVLSCFSYNASTGSYLPQVFSQAGLTQANPNPYQGYWVFCSTPTQVTVAGLLDTSSPLQTSLVAGWNLVGTPASSDLAASALQFDSESLASAASSSLLGSQPFVYSPASGAYSGLSYQTGVFPAFEATWVFAFEAGTLSAAGGPGSFALQAPSLGDTSQTTLPTLSWATSTGATSYTVEVATSESFGSSDVVNVSVTGTSFTPTSAFTSGQVLFWRVTAVSPGGATLASNGPSWFSSPLSVGAFPSGVAVTPNGQSLLVTNYADSGTLTVVNLTTGTVAQVVNVGTFPAGVGVTPNGATALVTNSNSITEVNTSTFAASTFNAPYVATTLGAIAMLPGGTGAVLPDLSNAGTDNGLRSFNLTTGFGGFVDFHTSNPAFDVAVTPNGSTALVTVIDSSLAKTLQEVNLASGTVTNVPGVGSVFAVAVTPDGANALLTSSVGLTELALANGTQTQIPLNANNAGFHTIAITPDGSRAVVAGGSVGAYVVSLANNTVLQTYSGVGGGQVAISPDGQTAYFPNSFDGTVRAISVTF